MEDGVILVLSQERYDVTTEMVQDWLDHLGAGAVRLNGEDLNGAVPVAVRLDAAGDEVAIEVGGRTLRAGDVGAVWRRRWHQMLNLPSLAGASDENRRRARAHLGHELMAASYGLFAMLDGARWLSRPAQVNKLHALRMARAAGLDVPATLLTNSREHLRAFLAEHPAAVTKCASDGEFFEAGEVSYGLYTAPLEAADVEALPPTFFPSLVQERLEKRWEVRVFYLDGECWPMAIFSQEDARTALDFRAYNHERPNRRVPYRLPAEVEAAVRRFMDRIGLDTGSLDLVRTPDGRHVFLEVNPAGQFAMVAEPCNYPLYRRVAERLLHRDGTA